MQRYKTVNLLKKLNPLSVTYRLSYSEPVLKTSQAYKEAGALPQSFTLIYPDAAQGVSAGMNETPSGGSRTVREEAIPEQCQLYVGSRPAASHEWSYEPDRQLLQFKTPFCSGHFELTRGSAESHGMLVQNGHSFAATIVVAPLTYELDLAKGAAYVKTQGGHSVLTYDETSGMWDSAWKAGRQEKALKLTYHLESTPVVGQQIYNLNMQFESPDESLWIPDPSSYSSYIDGDFNISFELNMGESADSEYELYPCQLIGELDPFGQTLTGAVLTSEKSAHGVAYGVIGRFVDESTVCGTYQVGGSRRTFSVLGGKLHIGGRQIPNSSVRGTQLQWDFTEEEERGHLEQALPSAGTLSFTSDGAEITGLHTSGMLKSSHSAVTGRRLSPDEVLKQNPALREGFLKQSKQSNDSHPDSADLLAMTPYKKDGKGQLQDVIQNKAMDDFMTLMQHYIPEDLYRQFINMNLDNLPADLRGIFQIEGDDGRDAKTIYEPYTTAYLTSLLSTATQDEFSGKLNRTRADKYLKKKLTLNSVYQKQAPMIYKQEWMKMYPQMQVYLNDQRDSKEYYSSFIKEDCANWKKDAENAFDPTASDYETSLLEYRNHIDALAKEAAEQGKYWPYFLLRNAMTPAFLSALQNASLSGIDSDSKITQKVQQYIALITILDENHNSVFVQEFAQMIQMFQLSNILPVLFDLSGDESLADYSYAVEKILRAFADQYSDSADKTLANYAAYIKSLSVDEFNLLYKCMGYAYNSLDGIFVYSKFVQNFDKAYKKFFGKIPEMAAYSCMLGSFISGIIMFATGRISWKDLSKLEQVKLIATGVGLFAAVAVKVTQRAMLINMLKPYMGLWERVKAFFWFKNEYKITAVSQSYVLNSEFKQWLMGEAGLGRESLENAAESARILGWQEADVGVVRRTLGRNLDTLLVRGLGIIFAVAGIVMSSLDLKKGGDDMMIAMNVMFLASSCLDLIAILAGMAGFEVASSAFGVFGVAFVLVGFILMMIEMSKKKPTPIENFAKNQAAGMGFYMPYGSAVDSFEIVPPSGDVPSMIGLNVYQGDADSSLVFSPNSEIAIGAYDGSPATCLGLDVDADGYTRFYTYLEQGEKKKVPMYLTRESNGTVKAAQLITDSSDKSQMWICSSVDSGSRDKDGHLIRGGFSIAWAGDSSQYLSGAGTGFKLGGDISTFTLEMKAAHAAGLSMADITLYDFDRDREFYPELVTQGSSPKLYQISPSLPDFIQFDPANGLISQKKGIAPAITSKTSFLLSLTDGLGQKVGPVSFSFQVCEGTVL